MKDKASLRLTSAEMSVLWTQYVNDSLAVCVTSYFLQKVEDEEIRPIIQEVIEITTQNLSLLTTLFKQENFPIPVGFTKEDVNINAPRLYSDQFVLMYLQNMSLLAMTASSLALGLVTRPDIVSFFKRILKAAVLVQDKTREQLLQQGIYVKPPFISTPKEVSFVEKQSFMGGIFGGNRALTAPEITFLFSNIRTNAVGKVLIIGFGQTARDKEVRQYFLKGKEMATKHLNIFQDILTKEDVPAPMMWDSVVTNSTTPVFSDKLMMYHISAMTAAGIGNYGTSMAGSQRKDLAVRYASLIPEVALFAEEGATIMIKNKWLEEPPQADDRKQLIERKEQG